MIEYSNEGCRVGPHAGCSARQESIDKELGIVPNLRLGLNLCFPTIGLLAIRKRLTPLYENQQEDLHRMSKRLPTQ